MEEVFEKYKFATISNYNETLDVAVSNDSSFGALIMMAEGREYNENEFMCPWRYYKDIELFIDPNSGVLTLKAIKVILKLEYSRGYWWWWGGKRYKGVIDREVEYNIKTSNYLIKYK